MASSGPWQPPPAAHSGQLVSGMIVSGNLVIGGTDYSHLFQSGHTTIRSGGLASGAIDSNRRPRDPYADGREQGIRDAAPFGPDTPAGIVADWLDDQGRYEAAAFMRTRG